MHYLDHASRSWPKPVSVYQALDDFSQVSSVGDISHVIEIAQHELSDLLHIDEPERIQFMGSRAEALSQALGSIDWQNGDGIVISALEQQSMMSAVMRLARTKGVQVYIVPYAHTSPLDVNECELLLKQYPNIRLIALSHASHVMGCALPVVALADLSQRYSKLLLLDASQTAGYWPLHLPANSVHMLVLDGQKALQGPPGLAVLYPGKAVEDVTDAPPADGAVSMTVRIAALTEGVRWVRRHGQRRPVDKLFSSLLTELEAIPEVQIYGPVDRLDQLPLLSFNVLGHHPEILAERLYQEFGIWLCAGFHQSRFAHESIGSIHRGGTLRASLGYLSRAEDVIALVQALKTILVTSSDRKSWGWVTK